MTKQPLKTSLLVSLMLLVPFLTLESQQESAEPFQAKIDELANNLIEWEFAPGAAIVVVSGDKTLVCTGYGLADNATGRAVTADTVFYIASSTKSFTGLAVALCDERGELDLEGSLDQYLADASFHRVA